MEQDKSDIFDELMDKNTQRQDAAESGSAKTEPLNEPAEKPAAAPETVPLAPPPLVNARKAQKGSKGKKSGTGTAPETGSAGKDILQALKFAGWVVLCSVGGMILSNIIAQLIAFLVSAITHETQNNLGSLLGACILMAISFVLHFLFAALCERKCRGAKTFLAFSLLFCLLTSLLSAIIMLVAGSTDIGTMAAGILNMSYLVVNMLLSGTSLGADVVLLLSFAAAFLVDALFTILGAMYAEARKKEKLLGL